MLATACDSEAPSTQDALTAEDLNGNMENQAGAQETPDYKNGPLSKLGADLGKLYDNHSAYIEAHGGSADGFQPKDSSIRVVDDLVTIEAVAANNTADLQHDLEAAGMIEVAAAGTMVSGRLPIASLATVAGLESLQFARPSRAH